MTREVPPEETSIYKKVAFGVVLPSCSTLSAADTSPSRSNGFSCTRPPREVGRVSPRASSHQNLELRQWLISLVMAPGRLLVVSTIRIDSHQ